MKHLSSRAIFAFATSVALGLAGTCAAGQQVPFQGSFDAVVTHSVGDPGTDVLDVRGGGQGTHLGQFTFAAPHVVNTTTRTAIGTFEFTAANGDSISASFPGAATPTATPGVISIVETATITGGTGRFAGATGSFTVSRLYDRVADTTSGSFSGSISSPGASNR